MISKCLLCRQRTKRGHLIPRYCTIWQKMCIYSKWNRWLTCELLVCIPTKRQSNADVTILYCPSTIIRLYPSRLFPQWTGVKVRLFLHFFRQLKWTVPTYLKTKEISNQASSIELQPQYIFIFYTTPTSNKILASSW